uniref:Putative secreted protein n=1 Tax=Ixodes ricinus TaxID=34613 RepID=A0A6B0U5A3_IXORI
MSDVWSIAISWIYSSATTLTLADDHQGPHSDRRNVPNTNNPIQSDTESGSINQSEQLIHPRQHIWTQQRHLTRGAGFL